MEKDLPGLREGGSNGELQSVHQGLHFRTGRGLRFFCWMGKGGGAQLMGAACMTGAGTTTGGGGVGAAATTQGWHLENDPALLCPPFHE